MNRHLALGFFILVPLIAWSGDIPRNEPTRFVDQFKNGQTYLVKDPEADKWVLILLDDLSCLANFGQSSCLI
jgi:hypothetical protein